MSNLPNRFVDRNMLLRYHLGMVYLDTSPSDTTLAASSWNGDNHDHHEEASLMLTDHEMADWDESESNGGGVSDEFLMDSDREFALFKMYHDLGSDAEWLDNE
ncbi:hypothetical protein BDN67DRAFT_1017814 [Paxillus ammoniavirescens]|nr:hypothetical protein BDN67DRAFT_1017814 [Paxillus ammoniavirescens]